jgi:NAD(P)-dependent dehydrogenase (short-subunit alcohol dehydrogenase family)
MLARNQQNLDEAVSAVRELVPTADIDTQLIDLADLESVRATAADIVANYDRIELLVNNAGVMFCPLSRTAQGFEMQFGTNHLGHFLLTTLLTPSLVNAAPSRVVVLSSGGHRFGTVNLEDPNYNEREYDKWLAYGESKTANVLFAVGLDARLKDRGVRAYAVHPGIIMTNLGRHMLPEDFEKMTSRFPAGEKMKFKSIPQGAATSVWAATAPELENKGGLYLEDCHIAHGAVDGGGGGVESYALDTDTADQLWALSATLVGQTTAL